MQWPVAHEVTVPWRDLDAAGHVNNAVYLSYMEAARVEAYFRAAGRDPSTAKPEDLDIILARTTIDYRSPATFAEVVRVSVWPTRVGDSSFALRYEMREKRSGRLVAEAESVQVCFDYAAQRKKRVPERLRAALEAGMRDGGNRP
jgi:acyl-CoA thioester hydrolase